MSDALRARLEAYLRRVWPEPAPLRVASLEQRTEGFSQETFFFEVECGAAARRAFVAKREPPAGLLEPYDLEPEFRVLHALGDDPLPSPPAPWFESDPAALERPFYVMERLPGEVPLPAPLADGSPPFSDAERRSLAPQVVEALAHLHSLDWRARGFAFLGVPEPEAVAARELARWEERIRKSRLPVPPVLAEALGWLRETSPAAGEIALLHGDFRLGNWLVEGRGGEATLTGILDWEMVHLGDPVEDLAWCTSPLWRGGTSWASALAPLDELVSRYERRAGCSVDRDALHWYHVLSVVKMSAIELTGIRAFLDGRTADLRMAVFDHQLPFLGVLVAILRGWLPESLLSSA